MNVFLSGPMRNIPYFNHPAFFAAEEKLKRKGYTVFNPARMDLEKYGKNPGSASGSPEEAVEKSGFSIREVLSMDCNWICLHADAIALLPGWEKSTGSQAELALAKALGLKVIKLKTIGD